MMTDAPQPADRMEGRTRHATTQRQGGGAALATDMAA